MIFAYIFHIHSISIQSNGSDDSDSSKHPACLWKPTLFSGYKSYKQSLPDYKL